MTRKKCEPELTFGQRLKAFVIRSLKWTAILGLTIAVSVAHDMIWYSDYNPLYKGTASSQSLVDNVIKASIITAVFWYIVPSFSSFAVIGVYAGLFSWMALAQNLPNIELKNDISKVWFEHLKCALHLTIKFFLFRIIQNLKPKLGL